MSKLEMTFSVALMLAILGSTSAVAADERPCIANFTTKGSFMSGKQYQTWQDLPAVNKGDAYTRIYAAIVKDGWKIAQTDKEVGVISAANEVSFGSGKSAPLNILIEAAGNGVKVSATFSTSGAVAAKTKSVQESLCGYLKAAEGV